jgi:hypothetical protein
MTGTTGVVMWIAMTLMIAAMAGGALAWARHRQRSQAAQQPPQAPAGSARPSGGPRDE